MKKEKIIVDFMRIENILIAKLVELPRKLSGAGTIIEGGGYSLRSYHYTEITPNTLFLGGTREVCDTVSFTFTDEIRAKKALENFKLLIREYNSRCEKADTTMKEDLSIKWERAE